MKKIAVIVSDDFENGKGQANAELNRILHLKAIADYQIDVYSFLVYEGLIVRKLRGTSVANRLKVKEFDGFKMKMYWRRFSLIDYILTVKFHLGPIVNKGWMKKYVSIFKDYDVVVANSDDCGELALAVYNKYKIPYCVTWHGSDIHTAPFRSKYAMNNTRQILENAHTNFMVSNALLETSQKITTIANRIVLYNGVSPSFVRFDNQKRSEIRKTYNPLNKKIIAFAGNLFPVKNPKSLPEIFSKIHESLKDDVEFWVMGGGKYFGYVKNKCTEYKVPVKMYGDVPSRQMPTLLNCVDVLVLPSINEGLPLITVESLACGSNVVGSRVGGIPEAIGVENTFELDDDFVLKISSRIIEMLTKKTDQPLLPCFSWTETAKIENNIYQRIFKI